MRIKEIRVDAGQTGVISTGEFQNSKPSFNSGVTIEGNWNVLEYRQIVKKMQEDLHEVCVANFLAAEQDSIARMIQKQYNNIRFYDKLNKKYPRVTSIIDIADKINGRDEFANIPVSELNEYAAQGQINHLKLEMFVKTGKWLMASEIPRALVYIDILAKGTLGLPPDSGDIKAFFEKYPMKFIASEQTVFNEEYLYAGTMDLKAIPIMNKAWEDVGAKEVITICDVKRSLNKVKNAKQAAAYAKADGEGEQLAIIPINDKTQQGYSKPLIIHDIDAYFEMFKQDRETFKTRFNI